MVVHIEADDKGATDWPLQVDAEEQTPARLIACRMQKRPGRRDVPPRFFLENPCDIEHVAPSP
jgi:hypothetical protein